jgi:HSP20 family molecular chaperone IbpA
MSSSPFHGIFSAFTQAQEEERAPLRQPARVEHVVESTPVETTIPAKAEPTTGRVAVDIYEQDDYYIIKAALAGVRMSDLDIEVDGNILTIRGERRQTDDVPQNQYYLQECYWGPFSRSVTLPTPVDAKKVRATFNKDCILKILVPKEERVKIIRISES